MTRNEISLLAGAAVSGVLLGIKIEQQRRIIERQQKSILVIRDGFIRMARAAGPEAVGKVLQDYEFELVLEGVNLDETEPEK